jgi:hypothetical protein
VGQQEVHEYEALSGCPGGYLYCWLILFCQSLQTILRIFLDITHQKFGYRTPSQVENDYYQT